MHVGCLSKEQSKIQDRSPSMTLQNVSFQMILVPKENAKIPCNVANHGHTMTHALPIYIQR